MRFTNIWPFHRDIFIALVHQQYPGNGMFYKTEWHKHTIRLKFTMKLTTYNRII